MSRFYEADGESPSEHLYFPNLRRAVRSDRGQRVLRDFIEALLVMPRRRLVANAIKTPEGEVCAVGAYALHKGVNLDRCPVSMDDTTLVGWEGDQEETIALGESLGMGKMIAWHLGFINDVECDTVEPWRAERAREQRDPESVVIGYEDGVLTYLVRRRIVVEEFDPKEGRVIGRFARDPVGEVYTTGVSPEDRWRHVYDWAVSQVRWNLPVPAMA